MAVRRDIHIVLSIDVFLMPIASSSHRWKNIKSIQRIQLCTLHVSKGIREKEGNEFHPLRGAYVIIPCPYAVCQSHKLSVFHPPLY